jgi:hypothetical protein
MAPEQAQGHPASPATLLSARVAGLPDGLDAVLSRALAKDPAARPPTCRAFAEAVAAFAPAGITPPPGLSGRGAPARSTTARTILSTSDPRPATLAPGTTPWAPRATPPPVRLSGPRPGLTSDQTVLTRPRRAVRGACPRRRGSPAHPLLAARERLEPVRKLTHRLSREDFQFALDEAQRVLKGRPLNPEAKYLETYARGGLAYVAGKDGVASATLVEAFTELKRRKKRESRPIGSFLLRPDGTSGQPNAWQLALGYGDARGEVMGLIEKDLAANPRSVRALKARAQLRRMQGLDEPQPN